MQVRILNVSVETITKGKNSYQKAEVLYENNGQKKTQNLVSFSNPVVFKAVVDAAPGTVLDVRVGKNDAGYNTWEGISAASADAPAPAAAPLKASSLARDFESKDERTARQRYIIRQSSLSNAISILTTGAKAPPATKDVLSLAEELAAFVFQDNAADDLFVQPNDLDTDIPH